MVTSAYSGGVNGRFQHINTDIWGYEYAGPAIETGKARFRLRSGVQPDNKGFPVEGQLQAHTSYLRPITLSFSLTAAQSSWSGLGVALWDDRPASDGSQFNEICFGYTTDQTFTKTQLWVESSRHGEQSPP
ncbi:hypothetical protein DL768_011809 [Monosporascus sp. mg162]|nr:hypothetical protein DL768_011809 [Monosporascus sp. mg162]